MRVLWLRRVAPVAVGALLTSLVSVPAFAIVPGHSSGKLSAPHLAHGHVPKPPAGPDAMADRQELPPGRKLPPAHRVKELAAKRTPSVDLTHGPVTQKLTRAGSSWRITATPDASWLAAPGRRFPVTVDPTIEISPPPTTAQDVMVDSSQPNANLNGVGGSPTGDWQLAVGKTGSTGTLRSLLKFPLTVGRVLQPGAHLQHRPCGGRGAPGHHGHRAGGSAGVAAGFRPGQPAPAGALMSFAPARRVWRRGLAVRQAGQAARA
jgi:hypothetical protein